MAESDASRALHNDRLTPKEIGAALGGFSLASKAVATPMPTAPHGYALQFIISIIKSSPPKSPLPQNE
jgi:hypothetical protein